MISSKASIALICIAKESVTPVASVLRARRNLSSSSIIHDEIVNLETSCISLVGSIVL